MDQNLIHTSRTKNVLHLSNRFRCKCRGNFSLPWQAQASCPGRFRSPAPALRPAEVETELAQSICAITRPRGLRRKAQYLDRAKLHEKASAVLRSKYREGLQRSGRKFLRCFQEGRFLESERERLS